MIPTRGTDSTLEPAYFSNIPKDNKKIDDEVLKNLIAINSSPLNHNNIYRGENLMKRGYTIDDIADMSDSGKFDDLYIGDSIDIGSDGLTIKDVPAPFNELTHDLKFHSYSTTIVCVGLDSFKKQVGKHHSVWWIPSGTGSYKIQTTSVDSGYANSFAHTTLLPYVADAFNKFFNNRMLPMDWSLSTKVNEKGEIIDSTNESCYMKIPSELDVFGCHMLSDKSDQEGNLLQLPYWRLRGWEGLLGYYYPWFLSSMAGQNNFVKVAQNGDKLTTVAAGDRDSQGCAYCPLFVLGGDREKEVS